MDWRVRRQDLRPAGRLSSPAPVWRDVVGGQTDFPPGLWASLRPSRRTWRILSLCLCACAGLAFVLAALARTGFFGPGPSGGDGALMFGLRRDGALAGASLVAGLALLLTFAALLHLSARRWRRRRESALGARLADLRERLDRAELFFSTEPQVVVCWSAPGEEPEIEGDAAFLGEGSDARRLLAFGSWLAPEAAESLALEASNLRDRGESFHLALTTVGGRHVEADGRPVGGRAVLRIRDVSGERLDVLRMNEARASIEADLNALKALLDAIPNPAWVRNGGALAWVNAAYARAVEAKDRSAAISAAAELLERPARDASALAREAGAVWRGRAPAVVAGERRMFDIVEAPAGGASVGLATDLSEMESLRSALAREVQAHARTLDQLSTAVAIFDRSKRLVFHNAAYRQLWALDQVWLDQTPTDSEILDRLRAARLLPEQADYRAWKAGLLAAYQSLETDEQAWHLPDGRTLRIVVNPNPQGGVTYLFDDVTERFLLESRFNALTRVQGETLDALKEGVAVFGSDGRMKLHNPAFARMWALTPEQLDGRRPHIDQVAQLCAPLLDNDAAWKELRAVVAGLQDQRTGFEQRLARRDGTVLDCAAAPLPDGATLVTFIDATAGVNVERALTERNQALVDAEKLRNDFVHHVSYELRSPLTNIIGFIQLLGDEAVGPLNPKQREYAGYVMKSSSALLAIINDILDLASIDADAMELSLETVDIAQTMQAAAEGVQDRLDESNLALRVVVADDVGSFVADGKRIRQILFNLLSNAIGFSAAGQTVELAAARRDGEVEFTVSDRGRGIPPDVVEHVFDRFRTHTSGSRHRGVGLGLSIVRSFVELHGGRIAIHSAPGQGASVTCVFPAQGVKLPPVEAAQEA